MPNSSLSGSSNESDPTDEEMDDKDFEESQNNNKDDSMKENLHKFVVENTKN